MDKIHILELINRYVGQSVHVQTQSGKSFTGHLQVKTVLEPKLHWSLLVGWREDPVEISDVVEIHPV